MFFTLAFIQDVYRNIVYEPQLNILYFFYQIVGDFGIAIIVLAILVNLAILPIFAKSYINTQKARVLRPFIQEIQEKYKTKPQEMLKRIRAFNIKHGLNNNYTFLVLFIQLFFISGLYLLIRDVVNDSIDADLYGIFYGSAEPNFKDTNGQTLAFNQIPVSASSSEYIFFPILVGLLSMLFGLYTFRWAPKPEIPKLKKPKKKNKKDEGESLFDPESMQKSMEMQSIYVMPIFLFVIQFSLPVGLTLYMATSSLMSLTRQIILSNYYAGRTDALVKQIIDSDPTSKDDDPNNNLEITADPAIIASQPVATAIDTKILENAVENVTKKRITKKRLPAKNKKLAKKNS